MLRLGLWILYVGNPKILLFEVAMAFNVYAFPESTIFEGIVYELLLLGSFSLLKTREPSLSNKSKVQKKLCPEPSGSPPKVIVRSAAVSVMGLT